MIVLEVIGVGLFTYFAIGAVLGFRLAAIARRHNVAIEFDRVRAAAWFLYYPALIEAAFEAVVEDAATAWEYRDGGESRERSEP